MDGNEGEEGCRGVLAPRGRAWFLPDGGADTVPGLRARRMTALGAWAGDGATGIGSQTRQARQKTRCEKLLLIAAMLQEQFDEVVVDPDNAGFAADADVVTTLKSHVGGRPRPTRLPLAK